MPKPTNFSRRSFLQTTSAGAAALAGGVWSETARANLNNVNEKLNIAFVGTANQARFSIKNCTGENITAFADVDKNSLNKMQKDFPDGRAYADYREMIVAEGDRIDAVVVATADHSHAPASIRAIRAGKHCYCEKPLTHTVEESRIVAEAAKKHGVATQLGTQIHAGDNYRRVVEIIQSGAIGDVTEVHVWVGKGWGGGELPKPNEVKPPPEYLSWDLWLGPAEKRDFAPGRYHPAQWRKWWAFGGGTLGDMACHYMDLPFWALKLRHPTHCAAEGPDVHPETCPLGLIVRYKYPAREGMPACDFTWYDGRLVPATVAGERVPPNGGIMFVGTDGHMFANYGSYRLYPEEKFKGFKPPAPSIPRSIGHHAEWIKACKEGTPTTCNFDYSGALTEAVLLGNVAYRTGEALEWDAKELKATNCPAADKYIRKEYRKGWEVA